MSKKMKSVKVFSYNPDNYSSLKEAMQEGNYSEVIVKAEDWEKFREVTYFASINHVGEHTVEIHHNDEVLTTCSIWNLPKTFDFPPKYILMEVNRDGSEYFNIVPLHVIPFTLKDIKIKVDEGFVNALDNDGIELSLCVDVGGTYAYQADDISYLIERRF